VSVSDLYIPTNNLPILLQEICRLILGIYKSHMNVEIGTEAQQFLEKEYRNGIFVALFFICYTFPIVKKGEPVVYTKVCGTHVTN
jgi:hypothetical protein